MNNHTCIKDDGGTPNRTCYACAAERTIERMDTKAFEDHVLEKAKHNLDTEYCVVALNEEAGEVAGWYKKFILRKNVAGKHTHEDLLSELGDVLYYTTALALHYNWTLSDVMEFNKKKLDEREKKGFRQIA